MRSNRFIIYLLTAWSLLFFGCRQDAGNNRFASVPEWSKEAIWYQIFVERFRNGDTSNDPTIVDMMGSYPGTFPASWSVTPWNHDWYEHESWLDSVKGGDFYSRIQARRYGGDLQGVSEKLGYLQSLGINAVYFNPLNDSPSLHKYDARNYTHIDRNFGPDPVGDAAQMDSEIPGDETTWKWTSADRLFLKVVDECHKRGIKVIMDYSWNHTGRDFWALNDVRKQGGESLYKDWYNIQKFDDPFTTEDEFRYEGWGGNNPWMPVFKKDIVPPDDKVMPFEGDLHSRSLREHIFAVIRRWLDPDNNGDPSDGVDGFRLDVAGEIPMGFWRDYRKEVRSVNPEAYLVGEIWWLEWPDKLLDPRIFLGGDQFDAIMNYRWFRVARGFFGQAEPVLNPSEFVRWIKGINKGISTDNIQAMMNVASSHDTPRLSTSLYNKTMDKYQAKPSDNPDYKINKPDEITRKEQLILLIHQFTYIGAPQIWNGEEVGMWGADDPDCRKPLVWDDIIYKDEVANFDPARSRSADKVYPDTVLLSFYRKLAKMRRENPVLVFGDLKFLVADDEKMILAYRRELKTDEIIVVFNRSDKTQSVKIQALKRGKYRTILSADGVSFDNEKSGNMILAPLSAVVLKKE